jgi:dephospho-CoA kinase
MSMDLVLLGLPSSGKSTVLKKMRKQGFKAIDSDNVVEKLYKKKNVVELLALNFGTVILNEKNEVSKKKLSEIVFSDKKKMKELCSLVHPLVLNELKKEKQKMKEKKHKTELKGIVFEIPVLIKEFEKEFLNLGKRILIVECTKKERLKRMIKKYGEKEAKKRINLTTFNKKRILNSGKKVLIINGENKELINESNKELMKLMR